MTTARARGAGKRDYPGKVAIRHAVATARELGIDVAGYEIAPGGIIRVLDRSVLTPPAGDDLFAEQLAKGLV